MPEPIKRIGRNLWRCVLHYLYGMFARQWNSSISAADAFVGLAVGSAVSPSISAINWQGALAVFATTWFRSTLQYFRDNPLPEKLPPDSAP